MGEDCVFQDAGDRKLGPSRRARDWDWLRKKSLQLVMARRGTITKQLGGEQRYRLAKDEDDLGAATEDPSRF